MSNQMLNATDPFCGCSKSTPTSPCNGGCGSPKPTACSPCVPSCHEQVNTYAELTANKSMFAGKHVSVKEVLKSLGRLSRSIFSKINGKIGE